MHANIDVADQCFGNPEAAAVAGTLPSDGTKISRMHENALGMGARDDVAFRGSPDAQRSDRDPSVEAPLWQWSRYQVVQDSAAPRRAKEGT